MQSLPIVAPPSPHEKDSDTISRYTFADGPGSAMSDAMEGDATRAISRGSHPGDVAPNRAKRASPSGIKYLRKASTVGHST